MSCENCKQLQPISKCTEQITIGYAQDDTQYFVYLKNLATGRIHKYTSTSDSNGLIILQASDEVKFEFSANQSYKLWIENSANTIFNEQNLQISESNNNCYQLQFVKVYNGDNFELYENQTLSI